MGGPTGVIQRCDRIVYSLMEAMRKQQLFIALLIALAVLSLVNDSGTSKVRAITGDVVK